MIHLKEPRMTAHVRTLLVVAAIVAAVLSAIVAEGAHVGLTAAGWLAAAVAALAAAHLP